MRHGLKLLPQATLVVALLASAWRPPTPCMQIYEKAVRSDPLVREAEANKLATQEGKPIARGSLLPQVNGRYNLNETVRRRFETVTTIGDTSPPVPRVIDSRDYDARPGRCELRQSVFRWDQWVQLSQADKQSAQADVDYEAAQQDLVDPRRRRLLQRARRRGHAGLRAGREGCHRAPAGAGPEALRGGPDRHHRRAGGPGRLRPGAGRRDPREAQPWPTSRKCCARSSTRPPRQLAKPARDLPLRSPDPADANQWVDLAMQQNRSLISSQIGAEIAKDDVSIARTGHYPTVDLVAQPQQHGQRRLLPFALHGHRYNCFDDNGDSDRHEWHRNCAPAPDRSRDRFACPCSSPCRSSAAAAPRPGSSRPSISTGPRGSAWSARLGKPSARPGTPTWA